MSNSKFVCSPAPSNKKEYISDLGKILVKDYGKKKYYKPEEVKKAHKQSAWGGLDFSCWGMSTFSSHSDFDKYHQEVGEPCDYVSMKTEMLQGLAITDSFHLSDLPEIDLDASWLDLGELLSGAIEGLGEFFTAIAEGVS
jgi:hypothetical protein